MITQNYKIDMTPGAVPLRVKVSQYDVGVRQLVFQLFNGPTALTSSSFDLSAQIVGTKPDKKGFEYSATVNATSSAIYVTVDITEQMTACAGDVVCEIRMYDNNNRISSANFILDVEQAALGADTDISATELPDIIDEARSYAEDAEDAAERAEAAAAGMSAGAAIGNSTSATSGVVDTNIDLGKTPSDGDRILMYVETEIESPVSLKTYNDGVAITTSFGSSGPESLAGLCLLEYTEDTTDYWALLWTDEGGGGGIGDAYAGLGMGKMVSFTDNVVNTDIDLHRAPIEGDRILFYHSSALANPGSLTVYNNGTAVTAGIFDFSATHPAGLTLMKYGTLGWQTVQDIADGGYTAGTGISISGTTISNSAPQNGDNVAYAAVSSVTSGDLGYFNGKADYFMIDFRTDAEPYNGKYTLKLSLGATIKHAVLKDRDGNLYADDFMSGNLVQCVKTSSGSGSEQDPVVVTVLAVENNDAAYVTATGNPITLTDAVAGNALEVSAEIVASQSGSGTPSPTNIRPISGCSSVVITDTDAQGHTATVTVSLGSTVYGGTLNLTTGELTITYAVVDLGTLTYSKTGNDSKAFSTNSIKNEIKPCAWSSEITTTICSQYSADTGSNVYTLKTDGTFGVDANGQIYFYDSRFEAETAANIKTALSGVQFVYELKTPTTTTLTAAQLALVKGQNTLTCNSGDMSITYKASGLDALKERVDELEDAVADLETDVASKAEKTTIGTVENGTTASQAYAVGEHFIRNDKFCTAIAAIASGATFTLNTNYVEGTIAEAITNKYNYSTTEHVVGTWIDGKTLYERTFEVGNLPSGGATLYNTDISTSIVPAANIKRLFGQATSATNGMIPLPFTNGGQASDSIYNVGMAITISNNELNIFLHSSSNRSDFTATVTMHYTKNS